MAVAEERRLLLDRHLAALRAALPVNAHQFDLQEQLLREELASARPAEAQPFALPRDHVVARVIEGVPLLHDQPAQLDIYYAADLFGRLLTVLGEHAGADLQGKVVGLARASVAGLLDPQRLFNEAFVHHADHLEEIALELGVDAELLATLAERAVAPLLRAYAARLLPMVQRLDDDSATGVVWQRGYCPVCGGWPLLAERYGADLARVLRCSACGSGWRAQPLVCPYCGSDDTATLPVSYSGSDDTATLPVPYCGGDDTATLAVDSDLGGCIFVCEQCRGYLKVVTAGEPTPPELLVLDDVASQHLDVAARQRGYRRPTDSEYERPADSQYGRPAEDENLRPAGSGFRIALSVPEEEWLDELGND